MDEVGDGGLVFLVNDACDRLSWIAVHEKYACELNLEIKNSHKRK